MEGFMQTLSFLVQQMWKFAIPLLIVALGGMFSERSGVVNIALEGIMVIGAFCSIFLINKLQNVMSGQPLLILAIITSAAAGMLFSLPHAYASIRLRSDQTISGTALNMAAPALAIYIARMVQSNHVQQISFKNTFLIREVPLLGRVPVLGPLFFRDTYITTYIGFALLIVSSIVLFKTRFGLRLRACGEHPQAADSVGVNVYKIRYAGVLISGALAGLGGLVFIIPNTVEFSATVSGYGFLALAVLIFGQWKPLRVFLAALFFGAMKTVATAYSGIPVLKDMSIPSDFYKMVPYIMTLVVMAFSSKNSQAPRACGVPYDKGSR